MGLSSRNAFGFASLSGFDLRLSLHSRIQRFMILFSLLILFMQADFYGEVIYLSKKALNFITILSEFDLI